MLTRSIDDGFHAAGIHCGVAHYIFILGGDGAKQQQIERRIGSQLEMHEFITGSTFLLQDVVWGLKTADVNDCASLI